MASCKEGDTDQVDSKLMQNNNNAKNCCICCEEISVFAIGACDHPICYKCSARMRVLSNQTYCATCRAEMKQVVVSFQEKKFADFNMKNMKVKRGHGFFFEEWRLVDLFDSLFDYVCSECRSKDRPFVSFEELKTHIRRVHEKQFCQICLDALANFPRELKMYTKKEMVSHRKDGDVEDKSHRGHPECKFCNDRFVDNDTLLFHLRKSHFWCHFCEHDGKQEYYNIYKDLRSHFGEVHFLCDEGECQHEKFTSVFRDKIDYQAHKLGSHGKNFNKSQAKEARKIEFDYSYRKRQPTSVVSGSDYAEVQSSELKHPRGDASNHRRDHQNKMNFSNFEDVEKERQELKRDKKSLQEKVRSPKINERAKRDTGMVASAALCPVESRGYTDTDEDVIGLPEHINKSDDISNRMHDRGINSDDRSNRMHDGGIKSDDRSNRMHDGGIKSIPPKEELPAEKTNFVQDKSKEKFKKVERGNSPKFSEDFPLLPGGVPSPDLRLATKGKQEDFPALGKSVRPKEPQPQKQPNKSEIKHVNGIQVTVKKGKEKGKSWTQQSGRANLASKNDFPTLQSRELSQNGEDYKPKVKFSNPGSKPCRQPDNGPPPSYDKYVNEKQPFAMKERPDNTFTSNGKGPPGLGKSGGRKKDVAPPGFRNSSSETPESNIRERNLRLVVLLQTYLDDFNLQIFKNISGEFRKNLIPASVYYSGISELLGDNLKYLFSELVALLPDEKKSEELLKLHQNAKLLAKGKEDSMNNIPNTPKRAVWGSTPPPQIKSLAKEVEIRCADCGLTFSREEATQHMESHGEAFPSLPTAIQKKRYAPFKHVHQSQVKNHWTK